MQSHRAFAFLTNQLNTILSVRHIKGCETEHTYSVTKW